MNVFTAYTFFHVMTNFAIKAKKKVDFFSWKQWHHGDHHFRGQDQWPFSAAKYYCKFFKNVFLNIAAKGHLVENQEYGT